MALNIYWTDFAKIELKKIFEYYKVNTSSSTASKIAKGISKETLILSKHPLIGQKEELLIKKGQEYRYLVYKSYKIIYWVNLDKNRIEINDVFDTRQNPIKLIRQK